MGFGMCQTSDIEICKESASAFSFFVAFRPSCPKERGSIMKRRLSIACVLLCALSLCACGVPAAAIPSTKLTSSTAHTAVPTQTVDVITAPFVTSTPQGSAKVTAKPPATVRPTAKATTSPAVTPKPTVNPTVQQQGHSSTVYITDTGSKYHRSGCQYLKKSKHAISRSDAKSKEYTSCSRCRP